MICKCGNEMVLILSDHDMNYLDIFWCQSCGRLLEEDMGEFIWYTPEDARVEIY